MQFFPDSLAEEKKKQMIRSENGRREIVKDLELSKIDSNTITGLFDLHDYLNSFNPDHPIIR